MNLQRATHVPNKHQHCLKICIDPPPPTMPVAKNGLFRDSLPKKVILVVTGTGWVVNTHGIDMIWGVPKPWELSG